MFRTMVSPAVVIYERGTWGFTLKRGHRLGCLRKGIWGEHLELTGSKSRKIPLVHGSFFQYILNGRDL
jgi:hypothetical protein